MFDGQPSRTAMGAAAHRAIHQLVEEGRVLRDPLAIPILGETVETLRQRALDRPQDRGLRFFIAARSELAEAKLAQAVEQRGVSQLVVLGAGLDTLSCRSPFGERLVIHEVDHPATQAWKIARLAAAGIPVPDHVRFTPVDFERMSLLDALVTAGFDVNRRSFFLWLGTVPYLTGQAVSATLRLIGGLPGGSEVVFDYAEPIENHDTSADHIRALSERVAAAGEPLVSWFTPAALRADLCAAGLDHCEDFTVRGLAERHWGKEAVAARMASGSPLSERGGHVLYARSPIRP
jgi:methyltransferase (TIGR00027 family)